MDYTSQIVSPVTGALSKAAPRTADLAGLRARGFILVSVTAAVVMIGAFVVTAQIRQGMTRTQAALPYATASYTAPAAAAPAQRFDISVYTGYGRNAEPFAIGAATSAVSDSFLPATLR